MFARVSSSTESLLPFFFGLRLGRISPKVDATFSVRRPAYLRAPGYCKIKATSIASVRGCSEQFVLHPTTSVN